MLVYTSTMYSFSNRHEIADKIYEFPFSSDEALDLSRYANIYIFLGEGDFNETVLLNM